MIERFKSHRELYERCKQLVEQNENVCQTILDYANHSLDCIYNFNLISGFIFKDNNILSEEYGVWKIKHLYYKHLN